MSRGRLECPRDLWQAVRRLEELLHTLRVRWNNARAEWVDPVQERFGHDYWAPLQSSVEATIEALHHLGETVADAKRDLGE